MSVYASLSCARNEIRLLEILPRASDDPHEQLECRLSIHSLDDEPSYTALSYVWGDSQDTRSIMVNDCAIEATVNLVDALLQQRELGTPLIWADALCINQQDDVEKAKQIQLMATIYGHATNVVAWIGPSDVATERTFEKIVKVAQLGRAVVPDIVEHPDLSKFAFSQLTDCGEKLVRALCGNPVFQRGDVGLILALLQRPYWTRLWTVQELCLARTASVFCGRHSVPWEICLLAIVLLSTISYIWLEDDGHIWLEDDGHIHEESFLDLCRPFNLDPSNWVGPRAAHISARLRDSSETGLSMWNLLDLTCNGTDLQATDPKDRVYAIHGLLQEEERGGVSLDTQTSGANLYIQTTLHMLSRYGPRLFAFCGSIHRSDTSLRLPSWAVDWTCTRLRPQLPDREAPLAAPYPVKISQGNKLMLEAALIGRIVMLARFSGELDDMVGIVNDLGSTSVQHSNSTNPSDRRVQAWRALLLYVSKYRDDDIKSLDRFVRRRAHRTASTDNTIVTCGTLSRSSSPTSTPMLEAESEEENQEYRQRFPNVLGNTAFVTEGGYIGFAFEGDNLQVSDAVYAFAEYEAPFLFRPEGEENGTRLWSLLGRATIAELIDVVDVENLHRLDKFWDTDPVMEEICLI